jgi:hypothetical protein
VDRLLGVPVVACYCHLVRRHCLVVCALGLVVALAFVLEFLQIVQVVWISLVGVEHKLEVYPSSLKVLISLAKTKFKSTVAMVRRQV